VVREGSSTPGIDAIRTIGDRPCPLLREPVPSTTRAGPRGRPTPAQKGRRSAGMSASDTARRRPSPAESEARRTVGRCRGPSGLPPRYRSVWVEGSLFEFSCVRPWECARSDDPERGVSRHRDPRPGRTARLNISWESRSRDPTHERLAGEVDGRR
jgi:hypothetical protein